MPTLHVHLDESGDVSFSPKGTKYYIFAATWTYTPRPLADRLTALRFALLKAGHDIPRFHATNDKKSIRGTVANRLIATRGWRYCATVVEKPKVDPEFYEPAQFYATFAPMPLRFIFRGLRGLKGRGTTQRVLIYTDTLPVEKKRELVEKAIKIAVRAELPDEVTFHTYHHPSTSNCWLQVTDYCCWAIRRKWESADLEMYQQLLPCLAAPERDVLGLETTRHY